MDQVVTDTTAYVDSWGTYWSKKTGKILETPGNLIIQSQNERLLATGSFLLGSFVMATPYVTKQPQEFVILGAILTGFGVGLYISSDIKMKRAGILLNENGVGVRIKI